MEPTGCDNALEEKPDVGWRLVRSPVVLPSCVVSASLTLTGRLTAQQLPGVRLPPELEGAAHHRKVHYAAGRYCAIQALRTLGMHGPPPGIGRTADGLPAWPDNVVGSITHTGDFVSAAVAWQHEARGIGIDSERLMPADTARRVRSIVATAQEIAAARDWTNADDSLAVTLVFSIKESLFKCLYPLAGCRFGYYDASVTDLQPTAGRFRVRLEVPLEPFRRGAEWEGRLEIGPTLVHTGLAMLAGSVEGWR
jgi:enterobactin synthetase component D